MFTNVPVGRKTSLLNLIQFHKSQSKSLHLLEYKPMNSILFMRFKRVMASVLAVSKVINDQGQAWARLKIIIII